MAFKDKIYAEIERAQREAVARQRDAERARRIARDRKPAKPVQKSSWSPRRVSRIETMTAEFRGTPYSIPINWDNLGLGLVRKMGFVPTKSVTIRFGKGKWQITGGKVKAMNLLWLIMGGGGLIYFLQQVISFSPDWSWLNSLVGLLPLVIGLLVKSDTLEFFPYELEMLAYDRESGILIISTITQPGGAQAIKMDLPTDPRLRKQEEAKLIDKLKSLHSGYMNIDGFVTSDASKIQTWSKQAILAAIAFYLYFRFA